MKDLSMYFADYAIGYSCIDFAVSLLLFFIHNSIIICLK